MLRTRLPIVLRLCSVLILLLTLPTVCGHAESLYLSPQGNDHWSGRLPKPNGSRTDGPLASLEGARDAVRRLRTPGKPLEPVHVIIGDGMYVLPRTLILTPDDGGSPEAPVIYGAAPDAHPVFSGGRRITGFRRRRGRRLDRARS